MDLSRAQRRVVTVAFTAVAVAILIGFWPVSATVSDGSSYSCGSGFVHSRHTWQVDSRALGGLPPVNDSGATPTSACPSKVYGYRDFALLLGAFALVAGGLIVALTSAEPSTGFGPRRART